MARLPLSGWDDLHGYLEPHPERVAAAGGWRFERLGGIACIARIFAEACATQRYDLNQYRQEAADQRASAASQGYAARAADRAPPLTRMAPAPA